MTLLKKLPLPLTGLTLAMFVLGNLLQTELPRMHDLLGLLATLLLVVLTARIFADLPQFKKEMGNPVLASVFPTYSMSLMVFSTYVAAFHQSVAFLFWLAGIGLHLLLMLQFTKRWVASFDIHHVYPSWLIVYIGIVTASVTAPVFQQLLIGKVLFLLGACLILAVMPVVLYRAYKVKQIPRALRANLTIICAPFSLLLAGYLNSFETPDKRVFFLLLVLSQLFYVFILLQLPSFVTSLFLPSFSAFTFPLVITALSLKAAGKYLAAQNSASPLLPILIRFEVVAACLVVVYVLAGFLITNLILPLKTAWETRTRSPKEALKEEQTDKGI